MGNTNKISYKKEDFLGGGSYGKVFKGRFDGKYVAVKRIQIEDFDAREVEFLMNYQHPNILKLFHVEQDRIFRQVGVPN